MSFLSHPSKESASAGDSRVSDCPGRLACYNNLIFVTIEGQRIAPDGAMLGIGNHRRTTSQYELAVGCGVDKFVARRVATRFLDDDVILGDDLVQLGR